MLSVMVSVMDSATSNIWCGEAIHKINTVKSPVPFCKSCVFDSNHSRATVLFSHVSLGSGGEVSAATDQKSSAAAAIVLEEKEKKTKHLHLYTEFKLRLREELSPPVWELFQ